MIFVERLTAYTTEDAAGLGHLRPYLSEGASVEPVEEALLRQIIESTEHEQLIARTEDSTRIIGAATLNIITGALAGKKGWLEDFVTGPNTGIRGVGQAVWDEMGVWCNEHDVNLEFTSRPTREAAHNFYKKQGAEIRDTTVFKKNFRQPE